MNGFVNGKSIKMSLSFFLADLAFLQLLDDEFLRLMIIRFVFCFYTMHLHRAFKVLLHKWKWRGSLNGDMFKIIPDR